METASDSVIVFTARCDASAVFAVTQCLSVCLSVTFVDYVKTNKDIFEIFSPSDSDTILVFTSQRGCRYSNGNSPNGGVECRYKSIIKVLYGLYVGQRRR